MIGSWFVELTKKPEPPAALSFPTQRKKNHSDGEIVAVGPGSRGDDNKVVSLDVKVGDRILFGKWSGTEVKIGGEELLIMKENDILGVLEGPAAAKQAA